jgi:glycosidase
LYLSPIFPSPSHHGYDTTDFFGIEPRLGALEDFKTLLNDAHQHQMRVVLDFVPNHCSDQHPIFRDAIQNPNSAYRDWFTFKHWPDEYATFFGVRSLPQLNLRCPPARQHILDAASYWLKLGVDGFRLDYAIGPTPDFWAAFRQAIRTVKPDCWTFGEVVDPPDAQLAFEGGLDGCLDFVLLEGLRQAFAFHRWSADQLGAFLDRHEAFFPESFSRPCFLDNHDMNRFIWAAGGDLRRLKLAAMCQFTLAGAPLVYYGTEVGLSQARDVRQEGMGLPHESRQPMLWDKAQDTELLHYYQALIQVRRQEASLRQGSRKTLYADKAVLAYVRTQGEDKVATILNLADEERRVVFAGDWNAMLLASHSDCQVVKVPEGVSVLLAPVSGVIIKTG